MSHATNIFARKAGQSRNPARIDIVLAALRYYWLTHPDLRLGQIVVNAAGTRSPFNVEDDALMAAWPGVQETPASDLVGLAARECDILTARIAELESWNADLRTHDVSVIKAQARGFEAGVKAAAHTLVATADKCKIASRPIRDGFMVGICEMHAAILALLEPKP